MKTITIKQPWAALIINGIKDVENRTWATKIRRSVLVHASKKPDKMLGHYMSLYPALSKEMQQNGVILGQVDIVDCVNNHSSKWFCGPYGFILVRPVKFKTAISAKGKLKFWDYRLTKDSE